MQYNIKLYECMNYKYVINNKWIIIMQYGFINIHKSKMCNNIIKAMSGEIELVL
jgi:hypothetical protein